MLRAGIGERERKAIAKARARIEAVRQEMRAQLGGQADNRSYGPPSTFRPPVFRARVGLHEPDPVAKSRVRDCKP